MHGLRIRFILVALIASIPALAVIAGSAWNRYRGEQAQAVLYLQRSLNAFLYRYSDLIRDNRSLLEMLSKTPEVLSFQAAAGHCEDLLQRTIRERPEYTSLQVVKADATIVCSSVPGETGSKNGERLWLERARDEGKYVIGHYAPGRQSGRPSVHTAYPIFTAQGDFAGAIHSAIDLDWLNKRFAEIALPADGIILFVDPSLSVVASFPARRNLGGRISLEGERLENGRGTLQSVRLFDSLYTVTYAPIQIDGQLQNAGVVLGVPSVSLMRPVWDQTVLNLVVLLIVFFLSLGSSVIGGLFLVERPLRSLLAQASQLTSGNLQAHVDVRNFGNTEMADLGRSLNRMAESLDSSLSALREANAWKSRLLAVASHDLRQPLQAIGATLALLSKDQMDEDRKRLAIQAAASSLQTLRKQVDRLSAVVKLDKLNKSSQPELKPYPLQPLFDELNIHFRTVAEQKGIEIRVVNTNRVVQTDPDWLTTILHNLVDNAIKYTAQGGKVLIGARKKGDTCRIEVHDSGIGIPANKLSQIFDAFYRVGEVDTQGLGLGLSIVKSIAEALGYRVGVRSHANKGTIFCIEVPVGIPETRDSITRV